MKFVWNYHEVEIPFGQPVKGLIWKGFRPLKVDIGPKELQNWMHSQNTYSEAAIFLKLDKYLSTVLVALRK